MRIDHQCILSIDNKRVLIVPEGETLFLHSQHVADFIFCSHVQYCKNKPMIEENMSENCEIIFTD